MNRFLKLFAISVGGALLAALTYAASIGPSTAIANLSLPSVLPIACIIGTIAGVIISPLVVWALRDKDLKIAVPIIYLLSIASIVALNLLEIRFAMEIGFAFTALAIFVYRFVGKEHVKVPPP
jgi:hypothetical protein